jgi:hypothetical protein
MSLFEGRACIKLAKTACVSDDLLMSEQETE